MVIEGSHVTPLLHDEAFTIDPELYAIGGATGGAYEPISEPQTDIDNIVENLVSAWRQFSTNRSGESKGEDSEFLGPRALHGTFSDWRHIKAEIDVFPESKVILQGLAECKIDGVNQLQPTVPDGGEDVIDKNFTTHITDIATQSGQQILADEPAQEPKADIKNIIKTLFSAWLPYAPDRSGESKPQIFGPGALHAVSLAWRQIKAKTQVLPDSNDIVLGLAISIVNYMYRLLVKKPEIEKRVMHRGFKGYVHGIVKKRWRQILVDQSIYESEIDNIIETLFSAWLQFPPSRLGEPECKDSELLGRRALHAISTAWRQIKDEKDVLPESEVIVHRLSKSMVDYMYQSQLMVPDGEEYVTKEDFKAHVTDIVSESWQHILDEIEEEDRVTLKKERRKRIRERMQKRRETAYVLWFYEPFARMNFDVPLNCRICCIYLCVCCSVFIIQVFIHTLLLSWPLSIGIMGGLYMTQCPMSYLMPYMMMALGVTGTIALFTRLSYAIYENFPGNEITSWGPGILLKAIEFVFLVLLIIHLYCFFSKTPSFDLGSPDYCNETFYEYVHWMNYVSMALVSAWLLVYIIKGSNWFYLRKFTIRPW